MQNYNEIIRKNNKFESTSTYIYGSRGDQMRM
jgi:hypothetical protein